MKVTLTTHTSTTVVRAQDFTSNTADPGRKWWTVGKMRHLIAALAGEPVIVTTDNLTGHTLVGVVLEKTFHGVDGGMVDIRMAHADESGTWSGTWVTSYPLAALGDTIVPLPASTGSRAVKWRALQSANDEVSEAIRIARAHPVNADNRWGSWSGQPAEHGVIVRYEPSTRKPAGGACGRRWTGRVVDGRVDSAVAPGAWRSSRM